MGEPSAARARHLRASTRTLGRGGAAAFGSRPDRFALRCFLDEDLHVVHVDSSRCQIRSSIKGIHNRSQVRMHFRSADNRTPWESRSRNRRDVVSGQDSDPTRLL